MSEADFVWVPSEETKLQSQLGAFLARHGLADYQALHARAADDPDWFWNAVIRFFDIQFEQQYERVLDLSAGIPWARWCVGGRTNLVLSSHDAHMTTSVRNQPAIIWEGENGNVRRWSYARLNAETCRLAGALRDFGIGRGDVVAIYMPMIPETAAAFLAVAKIGAIVLPMFSGFGAHAVANRLRDARAVAVLTVDETRRRGRGIPMKPVIDEAARNVPSLRHVVVLELSGTTVSWDSSRDHHWRDVTEKLPEHAPTEIMDAEDPVMIMYTSGTTGRPKGTIHTHCGVLTKNALDMGLCIDLKAGDRLLWMSDIGWMVGPKLIVSTTILGATMILTDGAPDYPDPGRLWRLVEDHRATILGIAPTVVRTQMTHGLDPVSSHDLSSLRSTISVGEPWNPEAWYWFFDNVCKRSIPILNYAGGTEVGGAILSGTLHDPLKPCAFGGPVPGHGADVVDENGDPIAPGEVGELVMRQASIGLSRGLWGEPERYIENYWSRFPDIWVHGDWTSRDEDGMWYIHGRSDDTIKIAGKRTGPAEIEALLLETGEVAEAAAVGVPDPLKGDSVICVCVPRSRDAVDTGCANRLMAAVVDGLGRPFRPTDIIFVSSLPKTRNQKIMRRLVRAVLTDSPLGDLSSLVNPEAVDQLRQFLGKSDRSN